MGETLRRNLIRTWVGVSSELGMFVRSSETRVILYVEEFEKGWKAAEFGTHVEEIDEKYGF